MAEDIEIPTWDSVKMIPSLITYISKIINQDMLRRFVAHKVLHKKIKVVNNFICNNCGYCYTTKRLHEDYSKCEKCKSQIITMSPSIMGLDIKKTSELTDIVPYMQRNCEVYFKNNWSCENDEFLTIKYKPQIPCFSAKFIVGDEACDNSIQNVIYKAALLCPFLWDKTFDWQLLYKKTSENGDHLTPLFIEFNLRGEL